MHGVVVVLVVVVASAGVCLVCAVVACALPPPLPLVMTGSMQTIASLCLQMMLCHYKRFEAIAEPVIV